MHDVTVAKSVTFPLSSDSIVSIDRAYIDYKWLNSLDKSGVWFVTRAKSNIDYVVTGQHPVAGKGVRKDQTILLNGTVQGFPGESLIGYRITDVLAGHGL